METRKLLGKKLSSHITQGTGHRHIGIPMDAQALNAVIPLVGFLMVNSTSSEARY